MKKHDIFTNMYAYSKNLLTPGKVAKLAGVSYSTVCRAIEKKQLKVIKKSTVVMTRSNRMGRRPEFLITKENANEYARNKRSQRKRNIKRKDRQDNKRRQKGT